MNRTLSRRSSLVYLHSAMYCMHHLRHLQPQPPKRSQAQCFSDGHLAKASCNFLQMMFMLARTCLLLGFECRIRRESASALIEPNELRDHRKRSRERVSTCCISFVPHTSIFNSFCSNFGRKSFSIQDLHA